MYTFNIFCFGHDLSKDPKLNNLVHDYDMELVRIINNKRFEIKFPYHGGQCYGDTYSCIFGHEITDDDDKKEFLNTIRNSKKEDYIDDYNEFIVWVKSEISDWKEKDLEISEVVDKLINFIDTNDPDFYIVEASS